MALTKEEKRQRRKVRIRMKINGTAQKPRVSVFRSNQHLYVQVIDDENNRVMSAVSTVSKEVRSQMEGLKKTDQAKKLGSKLAEICKSQGIEQAVFDRNGYKFHGRVKTLVEAAKEKGLKF